MTMKRNSVAGLCLMTLACSLWAAEDPPRPAADAAPAPLLDLLADEQTYSMDQLQAADGTKPYYLAYTVYDEHTAIIQATLGAVTQQNDQRQRNLNIDLRVGDYGLDNTHQLRESGQSHEYGSGNVPLSLSDHPDMIRHALWYHTDQVFKDAVERYARIKTNLQVKVEEEDKSDDFSREAPSQLIEPPASLNFDAGAWADRVRKISAIARDFPLIYSSQVSIGTLAATRYLVTSEGTRLQTPETRFRITLTAATKAADGMDITQSQDFNATTAAGLPDDTVIEAAFRDVIDQVLALRGAPLAEPYIGPAILRNRAAAVFFHEIFGHRIEGHRQKDVTEGQTFKKKIGEKVLPEFISVFDDPTLRRFGDVDLRGHYRFDDEGVRAQRAVLADGGVLKGFVMSRTPIEGFPQSNGHGRRQSGNAVVARQANLIVESDKAVPFDKLRELLIEACQTQNKPYGLLFEDISGGFTFTGREGPQSFKVLPIVVYKVFADGRPDELIRGVDIVGTPLTCFEKITHTGDDPAVFNGSCGAESGWVPVAAIAPSILVSMIEVEKRSHEQSRPPILDPPLSSAESTLRELPPRDTRPGTK